MNLDFDAIRPYTDDEIPAAMSRIAENENLPHIAQFIFPEKKISEVKEMLLSYKTIFDFQIGMMHEFNKQVIKRSIKQFTYKGFENLDPLKNYLFVSNHRDIVLDSSLLQSALHMEGFRTTEITFGSNLMNPQLVVDIGRSNKMFKVERGGNAREFYESSLCLSRYIHYTITQKNESVWIAQRNGRTKDGNDATDQGIIKMFCMNNKQNFSHSLAELNIVPIAISYQWEPCDLFKTRELYLSLGGTKYVKQKNEDLTSILTGISQQKGNVHLSLCKPIEKEEYSVFANETPNKFFHRIAQLIDQKIFDAYKLWDTNYIAYDIKFGVQKYTACYNHEEKEKFLIRCEDVLSKIDGDRDVLRDIFLGIYANPVGKKV